MPGYCLQTGDVVEDGTFRAIVEWVRAGMNIKSSEISIVPDRLEIARCFAGTSFELWSDCIFKKYFRTCVDPPALGNRVPSDSTGFGWD